MFFRTRFENIKIGTKFNSFVIIIFTIGILLSGLTFWKALEHRAETEVSSKGLVLMETVNAVRNYTQDRINPLLKERIETEFEFTPEAIPTFAAREVFEYFRKNPDYAQFIYKDAAPNPINLRDRADEFETKLVEEFKEQGSLQKSGWREFSEGEVFYVARPFTLKKQSCLECHSSPSKAPQSLLTTYGTENGFGWELNQIVAAQVIYVPAKEILTSVRRSFVTTMTILAATFIVIIFSLNLLLKRFVIQRIQKIARTAQAISRGDLKANFQEDSQDEIGLLVIAFNRMRSSVEVAMKLLNQKKIN
ncbi:c-type heme family protein [Pleurocapsa sp. FMAR1]|uniref:c-type heme family protein n=1 Tax=Pleurocapsa sp. FMAR1 TaxID=3040204 RepID=UPI0029C97033|nr:DUF3365 domain-containing protein [Pleurocapsa sp. FMAR1]